MVGRKKAESHARRKVERDSRVELVNATQRLLSMRPPSGITGKQIAQDAHVQPGLIYHYFESKEALFLEAMEQLTTSYIADRAATVDYNERLPPLTFNGHELWWRAAANYSADGGASYTSLGWTYPVLNHELEQIRKHHPEVPEFEAKAHIIREVCLNFGWMFFKDTLQTGMGLGDEQMAELGRQISTS
ncbi:TetR/AcrR family transcriptional regulator [Leekyejoonella antrihumi]|uniref:TetR family transcriptional regulator n=1 Tax=Leekyejoonella antrihumi TaxID=1660198 RepID=A0A563DTB2_9MICO|nr:TetR/AcrR family transcriptional regulator [Leekyejoonella antrihumi]TWP33172.1 TetR family transcriptional regulator [Leekyejoonella antrihumi]